MRKMLYLFALATIFLASCSNDTYKITGTVQGGYDGEKVFLMQNTNAGFINADSAVIADGKFVFEGAQPEAVYRYIAFTDGENDPIFTDFFLENGNIKIYLAEDESASTAQGTATNDKYQSFKKEMYALQDKIVKAYNQLQGSTSLTDEEQKTLIEEVNSIRDDMTNVIQKYIEANLNSVLGAVLLSTNQYNFTYEELEAYINQMPDALQNNDALANIKTNIETYKKTQEGNKFVDLNLQTPEGEPVKLSDYVGKGKIVLVDFWASWCGPCVAEMPRLVSLYEKYKDQGFEIVGVSLDTNNDAWKGGIERLNITWPQMSDLKGWQSEAARLYAIRSIPHVAIMDKDGTIISRGLYGEALEQKIDELMK